MKQKNKMVTIIAANFGSWTNSKFTWTHKIHYGWDLGGGTTFSLTIFYISLWPLP